MHLHLSHTVSKNSNATLMQCASFSHHTAASSTAATLMFSFSMKNQLCPARFLLCVFPQKYQITTSGDFLFGFWNSLIFNGTHFIFVIEKYHILLLGGLRLSDDISVTKTFKFFTRLVILQWLCWLYQCWRKISHNLK